MLPNVLGSARRMLTPPKELLARLRWFFLLFGLFFVATYLPQILLQSDRQWWIRGTAAAALVGMGAWWLRCFRRGRFPAVGLLVECAAFVACVLTPTDPFKGLGLLYIAVNFRSLYGSLRQVVTFAGVATACFVVATLAAPHLGLIDRTSMLGYVLPGVPPLAVIAHLVAVASLRSVRSTARERLLARTCLEISRSDDPEAARGAALGAAADIVADDAATVAIVPFGTPRKDAGQDHFFDAPITSGSHDDGVLRVRSRRPLPEEIRSAVSLIAAQLSLALSNIRLTADLRTQASGDPLTGLANRRAVMDHLARALIPADAAGPDVGDRQIGVVMIDLDGFKEVNDTLGHAAGDALLVGLAQRLRLEVRPRDVLGRLGGDEFAVVVADAGTTDDIASVARRLLRALADPVPIGDQFVTVGASIGVAVAGRGTAPAVVLNAADEAMYRAKRSGRNRVCVALQDEAGSGSVVDGVREHAMPAR
jgi:diguanylate cyclase (GGDEF)-like protein